LRLKAPPEPFYVLSGVNVPVCHILALFAAVPANRERLLDFWKRTAPATCLRGVLRVNGDDSHPSFFRFGSEDVQELRPACVMRGLRNARAGYALNIESFVDY
jgi:hypothetical protein